MLQQPINLSPDLKRLRNEGFDIEVRGGYLLVKSVPYVNSKREVKFGTLVSSLALAGDVTTKPDTHVAYFVGEHPCNKDGSEIFQIKHQSQNTELAKDLVVNHSFSSKPPNGYKDYYEKMSTYVAIISGPVRSINPQVTATVFPAIESSPSEESPFNFVDTASSRAGIETITKKLEVGKIAIVGLGGTGAYVLDLVAKTPVKEIHLYDGDLFLQHNAFRSPGSPSLEELKQKTTKVHYFREVYSKMHRGIIAHECYIEASNLGQLREMNFCFLSLDSTDFKRTLVKSLDSWGIPFIDVGMGIFVVDNSLSGILRVTTSTRDMHDHVESKNRIPFSEAANNEYSRNIQVADLNALNAALAVVKWKKLCGFYTDLEREYYSAYTLDGNNLINEDNL